MATLRGPSVADELLEPRTGSKPAVSAERPTVILPPACGCLPVGAAVVVVPTLRRFSLVVGDVFFPAVTAVLLAVVLVEPFLVVLVVPPTTDVDVDVSPGASVVVTPSIDEDVVSS